MQFDDWLKRIDATIFEPFITPLIEIEFLAHTGVVFGIVCLLERANEVRKLCVLPFILLEVAVKCFFHGVLSEYLHSLLQE